MTKLRKTLAAVFAAAAVGSLGSTLFTLHENQPKLRADFLNTNTCTEEIWSSKPCTPDGYASFNKSVTDFRNMDILLAAEMGIAIASGIALDITLKSSGKKLPKP